MLTPIDAIVAIVVDALAPGLDASVGEVTARLERLAAEAPVGLEVTPVRGRRSCTLCTGSPVPASSRLRFDGKLASACRECSARMVSAARARHFKGHVRRALAECLLERFPKKATLGIGGVELHPSLNVRTVCASEFFPKLAGRFEAQLRDVLDGRVREDSVEVGPAEPIEFVRTEPSRRRRVRSSPWDIAPDSDTDTDEELLLDEVRQVTSRGRQAC